MVQPGWDQTPFYFWNPAFKVRPQSYLTIASNVTLNQPHEKIEPGIPRGEVRLVNLPLRVEIRPLRFLLIYLPFQDTPFELVQPKINLAVSKSALAHAKNL